MPGREPGQLSCPSQAVSSWQVPFQASSSLPVKWSEGGRLYGLPGSSSLAIVDFRSCLALRDLATLAVPNPCKRFSLGGATLTILPPSQWRLSHAGVAGLWGRRSSRLWLVHGWGWGGVVRAAGREALDR